MVDAITEILLGTKAWHVKHGDSLVVLKSMPDACVDAVVTDPPAGMSFMGKEWDDFRRARNPADAGRDNVFGRTSARGPEYGRRDRDNFIAFLTAILAECYRVTKPGGRMLCWSIPRTMHWTGCAIEDAGWQIENDIAHYYAETIPPEVAAWFERMHVPMHSQIFGSGFPKAKSQLKPAREDWWLVRKPGKNVLPLNIDECRVPTGDNLNGGAYAENGGRQILPGDEREGASLGMLAPGSTTGREFVQPSGRWPANIVLSHSERCVCVGTKRAKATSIHGEDVAVCRSGAHFEAGGHQTIGRVQPVRGYADGTETVADWRCVESCPVAELDRQSGTLQSGNRKAGAYVPLGYRGAESGPMPEIVGDSGGASRFFNTFQPDPDDIETALFVYRAKVAKSDRSNGNNHPTVKSTPLMRHLVKLIAKPGDVVLDAFAGSGSTGKAAVLEGCRFIGIEREDTEAEPYVTIARRRIASVSNSSDDLDNILDNLNG